MDGPGKKHRASGSSTDSQRRELERENERSRREIEKLRRDLTDKDKQIADLERKLGLRQQNSATSSKPPSSDGLAGKQRARCSQRKKSGRKPGGQPRGNWRGLVPLERVNEISPVYPAQCRHCEKAFTAGDRTRAAKGKPVRHQVTELPKIEAHITEYQCHALECSGCGRTTQAALPAGVKGNFGPELTALIAYQTVVCRMPRRVVMESLEQVLNIPLSLGSVQNVWEEASDAVAEPYAELARRLPEEPVLNSDETGYRTNGEKRWLWALVAPGFVFHQIALTRGAEVLVGLLGAVFAGILCSDRCPTYLKYHKGEGQFCWAHYPESAVIQSDSAKFGLRGSVTGPCRFRHSR